MIVIGGLDAFQSRLQVREVLIGEEELLLGEAFSQHLIEELHAQLELGTPGPPALPQQLDEAWVVLGGRHEDALGRQAVSPCPARLLVVALPQATDTPQYIHIDQGYWQTSAQSR